MTGLFEKRLSIPIDEELCDAACVYILDNVSCVPLKRVKKIFDEMMKEFPLSKPPYKHLFFSTKAELGRIGYYNPLLVEFIEWAKKWRRKKENET